MKFPKFTNPFKKAAEENDFLLFIASIVITVNAIFIGIILMAKILGFAFTGILLFVLVLSFVIYKSTDKS